MRIICISDTHGAHGAVDLPEGDLLLHAGDFSARGRPEEVRDFMRWFAAQPQPHKVLIAGNHDFLAETDPVAFREMIPDGIIYLNDSTAEVAGLRIHGSPVTPWFYDWAFNRQRGADIARHWELIPADTQILITHGPPAGVLDRTQRGEKVGCADLGRRIAQLPDLKLHLFGHIHEARGVDYRDEICYVNACIMDLQYRPVHRPVVLDWPDLLAPVD